jgi:CheY-like chemotaxis protein
LRVFVAEDEFPVMLLLEDMLGQLGCELVGPASRVSEAMAIAQQDGMDVALLDVNLAGEMVFPVAEVLEARAVPLVFSTGYSGQGVGRRWRGRPVLQKPYHVDDLARALAEAVAGKATFNSASE